MKVHKLSPAMATVKCHTYYEILPGVKASRVWKKVTCKHCLRMKP